MKTKGFALLVLLFLLTAYTAGAEEVWYPQMPEEMPVISIETMDGSNHFADAYMRDHKLQGLIHYVDALITVEGTDVQAEKAQVKARGNYTLEYPQKSIRIKFENKQNMLGLNEGQAYKSWVLLAEWKDLSRLHSPIGLFLAQNIVGTDSYYCTDYCFVHLYLNGDYRGVYLLVEQQEVNPGRVDITEPEAESKEKHIGYFMEYDAYFAEEAALPQGDPVFEVYHSGMEGEQYGYTVKSDMTDAAQLRFLRSYMTRVYRICYSAIRENKFYVFNADYTALVPVENMTAQEVIGQAIDLRSLVDMYILHEIVCNPDVSWSSFYMSVDLGKNGNKKLTFQAPWDFDSCFGIRSGYESNQGRYALYAANPWFQLIAGQPWFTDMVKERWAELKAMELPEKTLELIGAYGDMYNDDFDRNFERWPQRIREGNHELIEELNQYTNHRQAADYLYRWLDARFEYLDQKWQ